MQLSRDPGSVHFHAQFRLPLLVRLFQVLRVPGQSRVLPILVDVLHVAVIFEGRGDRVEVLQVEVDGQLSRRSALLLVVGQLARYLHVVLILPLRGIAFPLVHEVSPARQSDVRLHLQLTILQAALQLTLDVRLQLVVQHLDHVLRVEGRGGDVRDAGHLDAFAGILLGVVEDLEVQHLLGTGADERAGRLDLAIDLGNVHVQVGVSFAVFVRVLAGGCQEVLQVDVQSAARVRCSRGLQIEVDVRHAVDLRVDDRVQQLRIRLQTGAELHLLPVQIQLSVQLQVQVVPANVVSDDRVGAVLAAWFQPKGIGELALAWLENHAFRLQLDAVLHQLGLQLDLVVAGLLRVHLGGQFGPVLERFVLCFEGRADRLAGQFPFAFQLQIDHGVRELARRAQNGILRFQVINGRLYQRQAVGLGVWIDSVNEHELVVYFVLASLQLPVQIESNVGIAGRDARNGELEVVLAPLAVQFEGHVLVGVADSGVRLDAVGRPRECPVDDEQLLITGDESHLVQHVFLATFETRDVHRALHVVLLTRPESSFRAGQLLNVLG